MISEGSCDTEAWSNGHHSNTFSKYIKKNTVILNSSNILQYYFFYCIFDQINAAFVSIRDFFQISSIISFSVFNLYLVLFICQIWKKIRFFVTYWQNLWTILLQEAFHEFACILVICVCHSEHTAIAQIGFFLTISVPHLNQFRLIVICTDEHLSFHVIL